MKRISRWAVGIAALLSVGLLAVEQGHADGATRCTLATLRGQYLFAGSGTLFPPAFNVTEPAQANSAGYHIFNGDGTGKDFVTFVVNGNVVAVPSPADIVYTLNPDCTGTYTVLPFGPHFNIFVARDGEALTVIETDPGAAISEGPQRRVGSQ
ncbi:MAG TPA: hypothetical protein VMS64_15065 [Candidatus Methylomirabilis sp.]|nr:hypothetical protein [Candidatus Methylomirabilis sp.]